MRLFLIGARGAGKTVAGSAAARTLGIPFVDTDQEVERAAALTIGEIIARHGEREFRRLERQVMLHELEAADDALVATGGGCLVASETRQRLLRCGRVLWLTASVPVLTGRIAGSPRPRLIDGVTPEAEAALLARRREPLYRDCATEQLDTSALTVAEVADVIQRFWSTLSHHDLR